MPRWRQSSGEHLLTASVDEHNALVADGWVCEGEAFGQGSARDAWRLYDGGSRHMVTTSEIERDSLVADGWTLEGVAFRVD